MSTKDNPSEQRHYHDSTSAIQALVNAFPGITSVYHPVTLIGSGAFSAVFKAIDLLHDAYAYSHNGHANGKRYRTRQQAGQQHFVAIKQVYAFAAPWRIFNELEVLRDIRKSGARQVLSIITAIRHLDQILIVLPYSRSRTKDFC